MSTADFGNFIRESREQLNLTQEDLANKLPTNKTKAAISKIELGKFSHMDPRDLASLCAVLGLDYADAVLRLAVARYIDKTSELTNVSKSKIELVKAIYSTRTKCADIVGVCKNTVDALHASELAAHTIELSSTAMLDISGLALWEEKLSGPNNFWIASNDLFDGKGNAFYNAVESQLRNGSRYTFFIPPDIIDLKFDNLAKEFTDSIADASLKLRCVALPRDLTWEILGVNAYILSNPTSHSRQTGFSCRTIGDTLSIAHELEKSTYKSLTKYLASIAKEQAGSNSELYSHITSP